MKCLALELSGKFEFVSGNVRELSCNLGQS